MLHISRRPDQIVIVSCKCCGSEVGIACNRSARLSIEGDKESVAVWRSDDSIEAFAAQQRAKKNRGDK